MRNAGDRAAQIGLEMVAEKNAEIERLRAALEIIAAGGAPYHPITYPTPLACAADTIQNFMRIARYALAHS